MLEAIEAIEERQKLRRFKFEVQQKDFEYLDG